MTAEKTSTSKVAAHHPAQDAYKVTALVLQGGGALGCVSGGCVSGAQRSGFASELDCGHFDRRVERRDHRGQCARSIASRSSPSSGRRSASRRSGQSSGTALAGNGRGRSYIPRWRQLSVSVARADRGPVRFLPAAHAAAVLQLHGTPATASWYDTTPLRETLERLADFDRINDPRTMRVSVGAVNVRTGNFAYFEIAITSCGRNTSWHRAHCRPVFPLSKSTASIYWDGGMVSNTPLYKVLTEQPHRDALIFQVDLWSACGALPHDMSRWPSAARTSSSPAARAW
jgi:NTE family protein